MVAPIARFDVLISFRIKMFIGVAEVIRERLSVLCSVMKFTRLDMHDALSLYWNYLEPRKGNMPSSWQATGDHN